MGADSALAAQGEDEIVDTEFAPSDDSRDAIGESFDKLLGQALLEGLGVPDDFGSEVEAAEQPEALPSDEDEAETPATPAIAAATDVKLSVDEMMPSWVENYRANPKSINNAPAKHHPAIAEQARELDRADQARAIEQAVQAGEQRAMQRIQAEQQRQATIAAVDEINQLKATDAEGYVTWRDQYPDRARNYDAFLEEQRNPQPRQVDTAAIAMEQAHKAAAPILAKLTAAPEAMAKIQAKQAANPNLYYGPDGLADLASDAAEALADVRIAAERKKEAPARAALEQRQANTDERRRAPRPDVSAGQRGGEPLTDDVDELFRLGLEEAFRGPNAKTMAVH